MGKVDPKLLEMADVFHMPKAARMKYIILPAMAPRLSELLRGKKSAQAAEPAQTANAASTGDTAKPGQGDMAGGAEQKGGGR